MSTKLKNVLLTAALTSLLVGCKKNVSNTIQAPPAELLQAAREYFTTSTSTSTQTLNGNNFRASQPKTIDWNSSTYEHQSSGDLLVAPILYDKTFLITSQAYPNVAFSLSNVTNLVIYRDSNQVFHSAVVTLIPDSNTINTAPTGFVLQEDWYGNSLAKPFHLGSLGANHAPSVETDVVQSIQVCNEIDGYNYSPDDPSGGVAWSETSCTTYGFNQDTGPGASPFGRLPGLPALTRAPIPLAVVSPPPTTAITDISAYFGCFTNGTTPDHTYSVQVCVEQTQPGTRIAWAVTSGGIGGSSAAGNVVNVGHTFLILTENNQGNIITRNIGFYPVSTVVNNTSVQGQLGDDQGHDYNLSLTVNLSSAQFFSMLNYVALGNNQGYDYNLSSNNCTTFAIHAMAAGGVTLPATQGSWPGGSGDDPGDLGQDLTDIALSPGMSLNTVQNAHPNIGSCN